MNDIQDILSKTTDAVQQAIEAAYKRGFDDGRVAGQQKAAATIKSRLADLFHLTDDVQSPGEYTDGDNLLTVRADTPHQAEAEQRAAPGTVKPVILATVANSNNGVSTRDIERATGIKHNSVRGTLWQLHKEGAITRNEEGRWIPTPPVKEAAKQQSLETYLEEIRKAEAKNSEAPPAEAGDASETTPGGAGTPGTGES